MSGAPSSGIATSAEWERRFQPLMVATGFVLGMTAPIEVLYAKRFGVGSLAIAGFLMCSAVGVLAVDVLGTRVIPRVDPRRTLMTGLLVFGASTALFGATPVFESLLLARVAQGFAGAVLGGATLQAAIRVHASRERALGGVQSSLLFGGALGAPVGGAVAGLVPGTAGYRLAFFLCAALSGAVALWLRAMPPLTSTAAGAEAPKAEIGLPRFAGQLMGPALALGVLGHYLRSGVETTALPLVGDARGLSTATIGLAIGLLAAVQIVTLRLAGRVFERFAPARCLLVALVLGIIAAAVLAFVATTPGFLAAALMFGLVDAVAMVAPPLVIMALSTDAASGLASYRLACGVGSLIGATSVNATVAAMGTAGALSSVGLVLLGGIALIQVIGHRLEPA